MIAIPAHNPTRVAIAAFATSIVALLSSNVARADVDHEITKVNVSYADLDLNTAKGTKILYVRLQGAADEACGDDLSQVGLRERLEIQRCRQEAIESAVASIDRPRLTTLYDRRFPHAPLG